MLKRTLAIILSALTLAAGFGRMPAHARTQTSPQQADAQRAEKSRTEVRKIGVGEKARVEVRLRDKTKLKGRVTQAGEDSFTLADAKTGSAQAVSYADVEKVSKPGGVSTRTWAIVGVAAVAAVVVAVTVLNPVLCDGGAGC